MIGTFQEYLEATSEYGVVTQLNYPIVFASGLPGAKLKEIVLFETGQLGEVFALGRDTVEILLLSKEQVRVGTRVARTNNPFTIPVGKELLGHVIDPLCVPITPNEHFVQPQERREVENKPLDITHRSKITKQLHTGTAVVDMMIPLGKGQKELIIGDRKTGKSSFLLTVVKNQVLEGTIVIYAAIARKNSDIKSLKEYFEKQGIMEKITIVATSPHDPPSLIFLTPYTAMTIAEYFRDQGQDVVVVLDDLSTHAKFYREISLVGKNFPGRDSYPGDIFYIHARLMERTGNFLHKDKEPVAITCLPVAETVEGDFTGYIATNLMGMTDGHIFFDSNVYAKGRRPAINIPLSVTRVGRQTQNKVKRDINRELTSFFSLYEKMQNFSHFGAELTDTVKNVLKNGDVITEFFNQMYTDIIPEQVQLVLFCLLWLQFVDVQEDSIANYRTRLTQAAKEEQTKKLFEQLFTANTFNELLGNVAKHKDELAALCKKKIN